MYDTLYKMYVHAYDNLHMLNLTHPILILNIAIIFINAKEECTALTFTTFSR